MAELSNTGKSLKVDKVTLWFEGNALNVSIGDSDFLPEGAVFSVDRGSAAAIQRVADVMTQKQAARHSPAPPAAKP